MRCDERTGLIRAYVDAWLGRDLAAFLATLSDDVCVTECDGHAIGGREACRKWFKGWHRAPTFGSVDVWDTGRVHCDQDDAATVEWSFRCTCFGRTTSFDGISVSEFADGRICSIREYRRDVRTPMLMV